MSDLENRDEANGHNAASQQLALFVQNDTLREELANLDVLSLSPLEALNKLFELAQMAKKGD